MMTNINAIVYTNKKPVHDVQVFVYLKKFKYGYTLK